MADLGLIPDTIYGLLSIASHDPEHIVGNRPRVVRYDPKQKCNNESKMREGWREFSGPELCV